MRLIDHFRQGVRRGAQRAAFIDGDRVQSWETTNDLVERLASAMAASGLKAGSFVGVFSPNDVMAFTVILGGFRLGAVWVPINARNSQTANRHWLSLVQCEALFYHSSLESEALALAGILKGVALLVCIDREGSQGAPSLECFLSRAWQPAPEPPDGPEVLASVFPTGGTTGMSKAACWTLRVWEALIGTFWQCLPSEASPVHLVAGPMTHAAGGLALCSLAGGTTNVIVKKPSPELIADAIERHKVTHLYLPPTVIYNLLDYPKARGRDYASLKYMVIAAAPIAPAKLREAMEVFGPVMCQCYGQAEAPMFLTFLRSRDLLAGPAQRWASCGQSTLSTRLEIMGPKGEILEDGQRGEIVVRGSLVMAGYLHNPEATAAASEYGWHHTGDVGIRDEQGFVTIVDRVKDMIITGGFNVFSTEVEQVILEHPSVLECAVVGVPDDKWGEAVKAVVQLKAGAEAREDEILALVRNRLGPVQTPKSVEIWHDLPRSPAGKVLKREIRDKFWIGRERAVG